MVSRDPGTIKTISWNIRKILNIKTCNIISHCTTQLLHLMKILRNINTKAKKFQVENFKYLLLVVSVLVLAKLKCYLQN